MITTVAFDYGRVLAYPVTGDWYMTPRTSEILGSKIYKLIMSNKNAAYLALQKAHKYLNENHLLHNESEEIEQFTQFYNLFLSYMEIDNPIELAKKLAFDIVCNDDKVSFFDDVYDGLKSLKQNYKVAVISDTWPSLRRILQNNGIFDLLDGLVMSCDYDETKETSKIFQIALNQLKEKPKNVVFVDDSLTNLQNAENVGLIPILMDRDNTQQSSTYPIAKNINDVRNIIIKYSAV